MVIEASRVAVGTANITTMTLVNALVAFVFHVGIARLLTAVDVGLMSIMLSTIGIFNTITLLALNSAVIKYVSEFLGGGTLQAIKRTSYIALATLAISLPLFLLDTLLRNMSLTPVIAISLDLALFLPTTFITLKFLELFDNEDKELLRSALPSKLKKTGQPRFWGVFGA